MPDRSLTSRGRNVAAVLRVWGNNDMADTVKEMVEELEKEEETR